jgi:hypothetical protein
MTHIFISHVEEDADVALGIALGLEQAGFRTWCYETDSVAGVSYLLQTKQAIERSSAVVLVISAHSLNSNQITKEVVRAHESDKHFVPVLRGITHVEFQARQPEWREAIGAATSIRIPAQGVAEILPRVVDGLRALGVHPRKRADPARLQKIRRRLDDLDLSKMVKPRKERSEPATWQATPVSNVRETRKRWGSQAVVRLAAVFVASAAVIVVVLAVAWLSGRSGGESGGAAFGPSPTESGATAAPDTPTVASGTHTVAPRTPTATQETSAGRPLPTATRPVAIITPREGRVSEVPVDSLYINSPSPYVGSSGHDYIRLLGGLEIPFSKMTSFEIAINGNDLSVMITLVDGKSETGIVDRGFALNVLEGPTEVGEIRLYLREVKRVEFRW